MRTLILTLTVLLLAAPVWATVEVTAEWDGQDVKIGYTSDEGRVRAFAIDIAATGGNITAIGGYTQGDNNFKYGIFPGSFDDNIEVNAETGEVVTWTVTEYTPVAPGDDTGALGDIPGPGITIEMGSLYPEGGNAPPETEGDLCTITVDGDVTEVCVTANAIRGNVVLEDANEPETLVVPGCVPKPGDECIAPGHPHYTMWVTLGKPPCWCPKGDGGSGYQCDGDADGVDSGMPFKYRVYIGDLGLLVDNWKKKANDPTLNACADFDHKDSGMPFKYQVYIPDLTKIVDNWKKKDINLPGDCPRAE